ncbi:carbamoyl-phosphate synthase domain-containing protein, partial [Bacillus sp. SIMBA_161]
GMVVREAADFPSNFRSTMSSSELLEKKGIPGIAGIDTRKLTRLIRVNGSIKGILTAAGEEPDVGQVIEKLNETALPRDRDARVSITRRYSSPERRTRV